MTSKGQSGRSCCRRQYERKIPPAVSCWRGCKAVWTARNEPSRTFGGCYRHSNHHRSLSSSCAGTRKGNCRGTERLRGGEPWRRSDNATKIILRVKSVDRSTEQGPSSGLSTALKIQYTERSCVPAKAARYERSGCARTRRTET